MSIRTGLSMTHLQNFRRNLKAQVVVLVSSAPVLLAYENSEDFLTNSEM